MQLNRASGRGWNSIAGRHVVHPLMLCAKPTRKESAVKFRPACATPCDYRRKTPPHGVNRKLVWAVGLLAGLLALTLLAMFWGRSEPAAQTPVAGPTADSAPIAWPHQHQSRPHRWATGPRPTADHGTPPAGCSRLPRSQLKCRHPACARLRIKQPRGDAAQAPTATSARSLMGAAPTTEAKHRQSGDGSRVMTVQELPGRCAANCHHHRWGGAMYSGHLAAGADHQQPVLRGRQDQPRTGAWSRSNSESAVFGSATTAMW